MKFFLLVISIISSPVLANDLGVSISIGQPGFYGQINLGNYYPRPQLIYPNPVIAVPPAITVQQQPIYLYVPPGHAKKWNKHCYRYNACNQPVYFIQESWYNDVYVPHYQSQSNHFEHYGSGQRRDGHNDDHRKHSERRNEDRSGMNENYQSDKHEDRGNNKKRDKRDQGNSEGKGQDKGNRKD